MFRFTYLVFHILCFAAVYTDKLKFYQEKKYHQLKELDTQEGIRKLSALTDMDHFTNVLDPILVPRVVGTKAHKEVGDFIIQQMEHLEWTVEVNNFKDNTPVFGQLEFRNIIARLNPNAERYLVLACHYDSKYTREHVFIGAIDSAVPCAMMMNIAHNLGPYLKQFTNSPLSLMFIFFDGEEAFRQWGPKDSIYGARHLAAQWERTPFKDGANHLQRIDVLILLDLIGTPDPVFYSYFPSTERWYVRLANIEQELAERNMLKNYSRGKAEQTYFRLRSSGSFVEDDHIPFLRRGVDILHIIPSPFPPQWHTEHDNRSALDFKTIENLLKIFTIFVAEYMHITP